MKLIEAIKTSDKGTVLKIAKAVSMTPEYSREEREQINKAIDDRLTNLDTLSDIGADVVSSDFDGID